MMRAVSASLVASALLLAGTSRADKPVRACIAAHADGQVARDEKRRATPVANSRGLRTLW